MYDEFSQAYDRFVNWDERLKIELPFIESHLKRIGVGRILDSACGTGMHAIALAKRGYQTAGADISAGMIALARKNASMHNLDIPYHLAGFGELSNAFGPADFQALLCLGNSLPHLLTPQALLAGLLDFHRCLEPGGILLIQNRNFDLVLEKKDRWMEPQSQIDGEQEWIFLRSYDFDSDGLITFNIVTLHRKNRQPWQQAITSTRLYPLKQSEIRQALQTAGFVSVQYFGNMQGEPFNSKHSGNLVIVAHKPA